MGLFNRKMPYDRTEILRRARKELRRSKYARALRLLERLLSREPNNPELHGLIAAPLAERGKCFDAWESYKIAARYQYSHNNKQAALALYIDATDRLPLIFDAWIARAELQRELLRQAEAFKTLLKGRVAFKKRRYRPQAISFLRRALELAPNSPKPTLDLADLIFRSGQPDEALFILDKLAGDEQSGVNLKAIHRARWNILPSISNTWRWIRA